MSNPDATQNFGEQNPTPGVTPDKKADILQAMFEHYAAVGLDHQRQSATTSNILLVIAGAILTLIGIDKRLYGVGDALGAGAVAIIGGFGMVWSWKQHETYKYWTKIAEAYQAELFTLVPGPKMVSDLEKDAEAATALEYGDFTVQKLHVRYLWVGLHAVVMALGIVLAVAILALMKEYVAALAILIVLIALTIWILRVVVNIQVFGRKNDKGC